MDMGPLVPALAKLADYTASGIGSIAGTVLATWRASREAAARRIQARGEADSLGILAEGQSDAIKIIAEAQAEARRMLVAPESTVHGEIEFSETVSQRIQFQEEKRQRNIEAVVTKAALELEGKDVDDHEPDHDWTARFFNDVQDVSSEEMQQLWGRILAGEVERPGNTSFRTMSILKNLDRGTALLFRRLCSARMTPQIGLWGGGLERSGNEFVLSLGGRAAGNSLEKYGLSYNILNRLNEHGLIIPEYDSQLLHKILDSGLGRSPRWTSMAHGFQGHSWVLVPIDQRQGEQTIELSVILLTNSGMELAKVVDVEAMPEYQEAVADFFEKKGFRMVEVDFGAPNTS